MSKKDNVEQTQKLMDLFGEQNKASILAKMILSQSVFRLAQVKKLELVSQDGIEMTFDSRDSKVFKKFMRKLKDKK